MGTEKALIVLLPIATAFTAWYSARILLYMVLYPLKPARVLGLSFYGYIPKHQKEIAQKVATAVVGELSVGDALVIGDETMKSLNPMIERHLDSFLTVRLQEKMPVIASFVGESTMQKLKESMMEEVTLLLPQVIAEYGKTISTNPELQSKIAEKIATLPPQKIADYIDPDLQKALKRVPLLFAVFGLTMGGLLSVVILLMRY